MRWLPWRERRPTASGHAPQPARGVARPSWAYGPTEVHPLVGRDGGLWLTYGQQWRASHAQRGPANRGR